MVRKHLKLDETFITDVHEDPSFSKRLDEHLGSLIHQIKAYKQLCAVKLARRRCSGELPAFKRSLHRFVLKIVEQVATGHDP